MNINLDQLAVLEMIDRQGSFAAAASALGRTTSAVSYAVRTLERILGVSVFDRSGHRAVLTRPGRLILEEGRHLLERARNLETLADRLRGGWEPQLLVVLDGSLPMAPLIEAHGRFAARELPTRVRVILEYLSGVQQRFDAEEADVMLALHYEHDPKLNARPLPAVGMTLLAGSKHALHTEEQPITRAVLRRHVEVIVSSSASRQDEPKGELYFGARHRFEVSDFHSKREALLGGVGFGWLPDHLAHPEIESGALEPLTIEEGCHTSLTPHLVHRRDPPPGRSAELFLGFLREAYSRC